MLTISFILYAGFCRRSKITKRRRLPTIPYDEREIIPTCREFRGMILQVNHTVPYRTTSVVVLVLFLLLLLVLVLVLDIVVVVVVSSFDRCLRCHRY